MIQRLVINVEKEINGRVYRLSMEVGSQWTEAIEVSQELANQVKEMSEIAKKQAESEKDPIAPELTES